MSYILLLSGFVLLIGSGDLLVRGATAMALRLGIPTLIVGLTVVAFGTSAPELMVSVNAALSGAPGIAVGNVVGSNIANILLVLGLPAIFRATDCCAPHVRRNTVFMIGATILFIVLCFFGPLNFWHGALLFSLIVAFLFASGHSASKMMAENRAAKSNGDSPCELDSAGAMGTTWPVIAGFVVFGLIGLPFGAEMVVDGATGIAVGFGIDEAAIGLTVVALGTSLPELTTALIAVLHRHGGMAIGNIIGSNLFNLLAVMGLTAMVAPVPIPAHILSVDLWVMLAAALLVVPITFFKIPITRAPAMLMVIAYGVYVAFVFTSAFPNPAAETVKLGTHASP
ncbi:Inner membrane protein YrbG, predicted calcium/sodium:proton antiporter [hydrothermal vent metagenome]|uniref:Inner membrane protein YrbG, predicted calcium/sodium:proton antiporter n=1 Tax=hydrothermal vent metagenome TaxID=652676 RepID=A0A3B0U288_9ZZZZ